MTPASSLLDQLSRNQILSIVDSESQQISMWSGSVGAGKTHASLLAFVLAVRHAPTSGLIVILAQTTTTAYANVFSLLQDPSRFGKAIADNVIYKQGGGTAYIFGREVLVIGAKDMSGIGRIQGSTIGLAYVDEAVLMPEPVWDMLTTRLRVEGARLMATMNPGSTNHYLKKKWINAGAAKGVVHFTLTMDDNPTYDNEWGRQHKARMKARYSGMFYKRMIEGQWTNATGAVYDMWDPKRHLIPYATMPRMQQVLGVGIDFGITNPTRGVMLGLSREQVPRLVLMHEFAYEGASEEFRAAPSTLSKLYRDWLNLPHSVHEGEPAPRRHVLDPSAGPLFEELRKDKVKGLMLGINDVLPGVMTVSNLLSRGRLVAVDGQCPKFEEEVTEYQWSAKASAEGVDEPDKGPNADHSLDAVRYVTHTLKPLWHTSIEDDLAA